MQLVYISKNVCGEREELNEAVASWVKIPNAWRVAKLVSNARLPRTKIESGSKGHRIIGIVNEQKGSGGNSEKTLELTSSLRQAGTEKASWTGDRGKDLWSARHDWLALCSSDAIRRVVSRKVTRRTMAGASVLLSLSSVASRRMLSVSLTFDFIVQLTARLKDIRPARCVGIQQPLLERVSSAFLSSCFLSLLLLC